MMRDVLEAVIRFPGGIDAESLAAITRYTKLFWINTGPFNNLTARKFVLECTPEAFASAVRHAQASGAALPLSRGRDAGRAAGSPAGRCSSTATSIRS